MKKRFLWNRFKKT